MQTEHQEYIQLTESDRAHLFGFRAGVFLPLVQAFVTGMLFGIICGILAIAAEWEKPALLGAITAVIITAIVWMFLMRKWFRLTAPLERLTGVDFNHDGIIGEPEVIEKEPTVIRVELVKNRGMKYVDFPFPDRAPMFCYSVLTGIPMTQAAWTGIDNPFSRGEWQQLVTFLIQRELGEWVNDGAHAQGFRLTEEGDVVFKTIADMYEPPTPPLDGTWTKYVQ